MDVTTKQLNTLRQAITFKPPYCSGTLALPEEAFTIFYGKDESVGRINLRNANQKTLAHLSNACQTASFGVNQKDVVDESYRKAKKMDSADFVTKFNLGSSGLIETVCGELLDGQDSTKRVHAELYKLNVYGKGSFFKAHKDTPRSDRMFGSLVIIFPTAHTGGALALRHGGQEWTFDSAKAAKSAPASVAYVAFYSDVEHEVQKVTAGFRVTLTYNLFFAGGGKDETQSVNPLDNVQEAKFKAALSSLLESGTLLDEGVVLGFGLQHRYPIVNSARALPSVAKCLRGSDATVSKICTELGLQVDVMLAYKPDRYEDRQVAVDEPISLGEHYHEGEYGDVYSRLKNEYEAITLREGGRGTKRKRSYKGSYSDSDEDDNNVALIYWVTALTENTQTSSDYVAVYGRNDTGLETLEGNAFLYAYIPEDEESAKSD